MTSEIDTHPELRDLATMIDNQPLSLVASNACFVAIGLRLERMASISLMTAQQHRNASASGT